MTVVMEWECPLEGVMESEGSSLKGVMEWEGSPLKVEMERD